MGSSWIEAGLAGDERGRVGLATPMDIDAPQAEVAAAPEARKPFRARVAFIGIGATVGVLDTGPRLCPATGCADEPPTLGASPEASAGVEIGGEWVRLHLEATLRFWFYSDGGLDLPTYSLGVDVGPPAFHGTVYIHGMNVVLPYILGARLAWSPRPTEGRFAPFVAMNVEQPIGTLLPTGHIEVGAQWWLDQPRRITPDPFPDAADLSVLPERE